MKETINSNNKDFIIEYYGRFKKDEKGNTIKNPENKNEYLCKNRIERVTIYSINSNENIHSISIYKEDFDLLKQKIEEIEKNEFYDYFD